MHVPHCLRAPAQALEPRVDVQVFAHGELRVDRGELRAHSERKAGVLRVPDDGAAVDEDLACVWKEVAACRTGRGGSSAFEKREWENGKHEVRDVRIMLNAVVLPAPFGTSSAKMVFCATPKLTESTTLPDRQNDLETSSTRSASCDSLTACASARTSCCCFAPTPPAAEARGRHVRARTFCFQTEPEST